MPIERMDLNKDTIIDKINELIEVVLYLEERIKKLEESYNGLY